MMPAVQLHAANNSSALAEEPLVSVVTPFFNSSDYLEECIQSVLDQAYARWEYILVDNCSTDGSDRIAEKYAESDRRIRFIREVEFLGQTENYNRALSYISSESKYCKIVQADDWIYPHCLAEMVKAAEFSGNVGLVSSFSLYGNSVGHGGLPLSQGPVYPGRYAARAQLLGKVLFGSPTCVMYRSDIVRCRSPFFSTTTRYFEDTEVCFEILRDFEFAFVPQILSFNRRDNESIWAGIERFRPYTLHEMMFVLRFGPEFLDPDEFSRRKRETEARFYTLLAHGLFQSNAKDLWRFHREGLASYGLRISRGRVALSVLSIIFDAAFNPKNTLEVIWRRAHRAAN